MRAMRAIVAAACFAVPIASSAATFRLDDSMSQVSPPVSEWRWVPFSLRGGNSELVMDVRVTARIDTRAYEGRQGRIYMLMPADAAGITATWTTDGRMLGGRLVAGERALVYAGPIPAPWLEDRLQVRLSTDSRFPASPSNRLSFHFELETP
jgi:hypothetical protein